MKFVKTITVILSFFLCYGSLSTLINHVDTGPAWKIAASAIAFMTFLGFLVIFLLREIQNKKQ